MNAIQIDYTAIQAYVALRKSDRYDKLLATRHFGLFSRAVKAISQVVEEEAYLLHGYKTARRYFKEIYGIHGHVLALYLCTGSVFEVGYPQSFLLHIDFTRYYTVSRHYQRI